MIEKALKYLVNLSEARIKEIDGETYSDKSLYRIKHNPKASEIGMNTLSSLVEYIKANIDEMKGHMIVHVQNPTRVLLYSSLDEERIREYVAEVNAQVPEFKFNQFMDHESFCINLQSKFIDVEGTDKALVLKFAGTVESGTVAEYGDDGVTQKATIKTGIASKDEAVVPNPVDLVAYRTFVEVTQPRSQFIFRMKTDKYDGIECALFEADGGAWKIEAMESIKAYLKEQLKYVDGFTVIS